MAFAAASLHILAYDRPSFLARRQIRAIWTDIADLALARHAPARDRFLLLTVDRLAQTLPEIAKLDEDAPLARVDAIDDLRVGLNLLTLREREGDFDPEVADRFGELRRMIAAEFRDLRIGDRLASAPLERARALVEDVIARDGPHRPAMVQALVGLTLALAPSVTPFGEMEEVEA